MFVYLEDSGGSGHDGRRKNNEQSRGRDGGADGWCVGEKMLRTQRERDGGG